MPRCAASLARGFASPWFYTEFVRFSILESPRRSFFPDIARPSAMIVPNASVLRLVGGAS
jgi:hypothetical protein